MKSNKYIATTDASQKDEHMAEIWMIEDDFETESDKNRVSCNR